MWPDWAIFERFWLQIFFIKKPNICWLLWLLWKMGLFNYKICEFFLGNNWKILATFKFNICHTALVRYHLASAAFLPVDSSHFFKAALMDVGIISSKHLKLSFEYLINPTSEVKYLTIYFALNQSEPTFSCCCCNWKIFFCLGNVVYLKPLIKPWQTKLFRWDH